MSGLLITSIAAASLALALGYALGAVYLGALAAFLSGLLWLLGLWRAWPVGSASLVLLLLLAGLGLVGFVPPGASLLMPIAATGALVAWDLERFLGRLRSAGEVRETAELQRTHLRRLLSVAALGLLLAGSALALHVELDLVWALVLVLLILAGLSRIASIPRAD